MSQPPPFVSTSSQSAQQPMQGVNGQDAISSPQQQQQQQQHYYQQQQLRQYQQQQMNPIHTGMPIQMQMGQQGGIPSNIQIHPGYPSPQVQQQQMQHPYQAQNGYQQPMTPLQQQHYHQQQTPQTPQTPQSQQSQPSIASEWEQIRNERQKLALLQEKLSVDQELLKQEKKQRRRQQHLATQELYAEWQREITLVQQRTQQTKDDYEAKLTAQKQEYETKITEAKNGALEKLNEEHQEALKALETKLEEAEKKFQEEDGIGKHRWQEEQQETVQKQMEAQESKQQEDFQARQQMWLDKLHQQEKKQQERIDELKSSMQKDYAVKTVRLQEEWEEKSMAEQKSVASDYQQKLAQQLKERQVAHNQELADLHKELRERDDAIHALKKSKTSDHDAALKTQLEENEALIEKMKKELVELKTQQEPPLALSTIPVDQERKIAELQQALDEQQQQSTIVQPLQEQLTEKSEALMRLEGQLLDMERERDDLQNSQHQPRGTPSATLEATLMERDETIQQLQSELSALKDDNDANIAEKTKDAASVNRELIAKDELIERLKDQIRDLENERDNRQIEDDNEELSVLRQRAKEKDQLVHRLQEHQLEAEKAQEQLLRSKVADFEEEMKKKETIIQTLQVELELQQQTSGVSSHDSEALLQLQDNLASKDLTIKQLENQISDLKEDRDQHLLVDMDVTIMKDHLAEKEEAAVRLEAQLLEMEQELDNRKNQSCITCSDLKVQFEDIQAKYEGLQQQQKQTEEKRESSKAGEFLKARKEMAQLLRKEEQLQSKIDTQQKEIEELKKASADGQSDVLADTSSSPAQHRSATLQKLHSQQRIKQVLEVKWKGSSTVDAGIYTGFLNDVGNPEGTGTLKFEDGSVYDGGFKDGNLHGEGVFAWVDGDLYNGEWREGRQDGYGVFVWGDGRLYQGHYKVGQRHGDG